MKKQYKKEPLINKITQELESRVKDNLTEIGLAQNIRIYYGSLKDPENPPYLEFKLAENEDYNRAKRTNIRCGLLRDIIFDLLTKNHPEIRGVSYDSVYENTWRAKLLLNYEVKIYDKDNFRTKILSSISKSIENYKIRFGK